MKRLILIMSLMALACTVGLAQVTTGYVSKRDNTIAKNSVVIFPGATTKQIVLKSYSVTGDNADTALRIHSGTRLSTVTSNEAAGQTVIGVASTNGFDTVNGAVIIQRPSGLCSVHALDSVNASSVTLSEALPSGYDCAVGDQIWWCGGTSTNVIGAATVRREGDALWGAQVRAPVALHLITSAGAANTINDATVLYRKNE